MSLSPLFILLQLLIFFSLSYTTISTLSMTMDPFEKETLFKVMETLSSDRNWKTSHPEPCNPGSSWPGIECKPAGKDNHLHVTRLNFGNSPNPTCKKDATFPPEILTLPFLESLFIFNCFKTTKTTLSIPSKPQHLSLQQLSLKSNPALVGVIPPLISSLTSLQVLTLSQNHLFGKIPQGISSLTSLIHLDLSYNSLTGPIPFQLGMLKSLTGLDLSYNSLSGPIPAPLGHLVLLQKLDLSSNSLTGRIPDTFENLRVLSFLALSNNKLSGKFPKGLPNLKNLQYFIMDDNPMFIFLPFQLGRLAKLQELRLANSGYSGPIPWSFQWLTNLTTLSLENNKLSGLIPSGLAQLNRIYHLNLSRNSLGGVVPFNDNFLRRLGRNLDLSGNSGLCLPSSEVTQSDTLGVSICGTNKTVSTVLQPLRKSSDADLLHCSQLLTLFFTNLCFWSLYQLLL
ncbi:L domain-like protein [Dioscorea alata]|uniref:L domain-like protein n=1 Tax=Dioscorea alata TaxID=55571 RepID=A0ACB7TRY8_DIOAL|nr:L domain-like protein [Dioscorea alata]